MLIQAPNYEAFAAGEHRNVMLTREESVVESCLLRWFHNPRISSLVREFCAPEPVAPADPSDALWVMPHGHPMRNIRPSIVSTVQRYLPSKTITPHRCA